MSANRSANRSSNRRANGSANRMGSVCIAVLATLGMASKAEALPVIQRVADAENLAAHGETDAAREAYLSLWREREAAGDNTSADLHYNLGTLALRDGDVGAAVVHLLAAAQRAPGNDDIQHNLALALQARADQVTGGAQTPLGARLPPFPVRVAFAASLAFLGLLAALRGLRARPLPRAVWPVAIGVFAVAGALWGLRLWSEARVVSVVVTETMARQQPVPTADGFAVHPGLTGEVVGERDGFQRLRLENGVDVWVARSDLVQVP